MIPMPTSTKPLTGAPRPDADGNLAFAGLATLAELLTQGQLTPRELTALYLRRIERFDVHLRAFVSVRADAALAEADAALARLRAGERGPLLGIPVAIKDNLGIAGRESRARLRRRRGRHGGAPQVARSRGR
jgi:amidase